MTTDTDQTVEEVIPDMAMGPYQIMPKMTDEQFQELKNDIREKGILQPLVFDQDGMLLDGHHRFRAWSELVEEGADVDMFDSTKMAFTSEAQKIDYVISLNVKRRHLTLEQRQQLAAQLRKPPFGYSMQRIADLLGVSIATVSRDLDELSDEDKKELENLTVKGLDGREYTTGTRAKLVFLSSEKQMKTIQQQITGAKASEGGETKGQEYQRKWDVAKGQLWLVESKSAPGAFHRLVCGDAQNADAWRTLFPDIHENTPDTAQMIWTDPPYGVNYVGKTQDALTFENDKLGDVALRELLIRAFDTASIYCDPAAPFYVAHPPGVLSLLFGNVLISLGWRLHETLIWVKDTMVLGHSDYHLQHEPIYYGWLPAGNHQGRPGRGNHDGTKWFGNDNAVSVFHVARPKRSAEHPTMKPTDLIVQHIRNSCSWKGTVLDPFAGSFSTAAAAEECGRVCSGIELDPGNVAIGLERLAAMGLNPILIG